MLALSTIRSRRKHIVHTHSPVVSTPNWLGQAAQSISRHHGQRFKARPGPARGRRLSVGDQINEPCSIEPRHRSSRSHRPQVEVEVEVELNEAAGVTPRVPTPAAPPWV